MFCFSRVFVVDYVRCLAGLVRDLQYKSGGIVDVDFATDRPR